MSKRVQSLVGAKGVRELRADQGTPRPQKRAENNIKDFYIGYGPERISPGLGKKNYEISKIVAAENKRIGNKIKKFYETFIKKVYSLESIEVAELAKNHGSLPLIVQQSGMTPEFSKSSEKGAVYVSHAVVKEVSTQLL